MRDALLSLLEEEPRTLDLAPHEPPPLVGHSPPEHVLLRQPCLRELVRREVYPPPPRAEIPSTTTRHTLCYQSEIEEYSIYIYQW
jgi:hypothetical protein